MSDHLHGGNGSGERGNDRTVGPDPAAAEALIDQVLRSRGVSPEQALVGEGWRRLKVGETYAYVGLSDVHGDPYFTVFSPLLRLPWGEGGRALAVTLLELNQEFTLGARFSLVEDTVNLGILRPIAGLDFVEVDSSIQTVMTLSHWLRENALDGWFAQGEELSVGSRQLPQIALAPAQWEALVDWYRDLNRQARSQGREVIEAWGKAGLPITLRKRGVELSRPIGEGTAPVFTAEVGDYGSLRVSLIERDAPPEATEALLGWAKGRIPVHQRRGATTIALGARTTVSLARQLAVEMVRLAAAAGATPVAVPAPRKTHRQEFLEACDPLVRSVYTTLMEGWRQAGGEVRVTGPGRISLQWGAGPHEGGVVSRDLHILSLVTLTPPKGSEPAAINVAWGLAADSPTAYLDAFPKEVAEFEHEVAALPGWVAGRRPKIAMGEDFTKEHAERLLSAMVKLMRAEQEAFRKRRI